MEAVMKVGGSLAEEPKHLKALCKSLSNLARVHRLLVVPGGGKFADVVRGFDRTFSLSDAAVHKMAVLAMDQFGLMLSDLIVNAQPIYTLGEARRIIGKGLLPILLPSNLIFRSDPLEHSWDVTSDSIAAYVASLLGVRRLILITNVDGVFTQAPELDASTRLLDELTAEKLSEWGRRTCVDRYLPKILLRERIDAYVVSGKHPERIKAILEGRRTVCTKITAQPSRSL